MTARKTTPAADLPDRFEPDRFYAVDLARKTVWKGRTLSPAMNPVELRGDVCEARRADLAKASPIEG